MSTEPGASDILGETHVELAAEVPQDTTHAILGEGGPDNMTMLYKLVEGSVQEQHYGLKLARVVPLPSRVYEVAEQVAHRLELQSRRKKRTSAAVMKEKKRRLILNLKEHLTQAKNGVMDGPVLAEWLRQLQREFVVRMTAIEAEAEEAANTDSDEEDAEVDEEE